MRLPNAAPEEGPVIDFDYFNNWSVGGGEKHPAYFAGGTQWFVAHPSDLGSKPCLHWMTKGALPCRFCTGHKTPCQLGYVPLWRAVDSRPLFVIVYGEEREHVERLRLHERVCVGREKDKGARIWVRRTMEQEPRFQTALLRRMREQDITKSLLRIWKLPELVAWFFSVSDTGVSLPPGVVVKSNGEPFGPMTEAAARRFGASDETETESAALFDDAGRRMLERVQKDGVKPNGKHKPK